MSCRVRGAASVDVPAASPAVEWGKWAWLIVPVVPTVVVAVCSLWLATPPTTVVIEEMVLVKTIASEAVVEEAIPSRRRHRLDNSWRVNMTCSRAKHLIAVASAVVGLSLAACGSARRWDFGLDSSSPDGNQVTLIEYAGDPPTQQLILLDLDKGDVAVLAEGIAFPPDSQFSPDGRYVLFRSPDGYFFADTATHQQVEVADEGVEAWLLPSGELLVMESTDGLWRFFIVHDLDRPQVRRLLLDRVRYTWSNQPLVLDAFGLQLPVCAQPRAPDHAVWAVVDEDSAVALLVAARDGVFVRHLPLKLSAGVRMLLDRQASALEAAMREEVRRQVEQEAAEAEESLSEDELEGRVEERLQEQVASYLRWSVLGILSPDGMRLLFLRYELGEKAIYSLYLIDLETGEEPLVLSAETEWIPAAAFSPDGRQILFESNRDGGRSLYVANADGTNIRRVVEEGGLNPCWH